MDEDEMTEGGLTVGVVNPEAVVIMMRMTAGLLSTSIPVEMSNRLNLMRTSQNTWKMVTYPFYPLTSWPLTMRTALLAQSGRMLIYRWPRPIGRKD